MTKVLTFKPRDAEVRAMRIIIGETTRSQIEEFCPTANIGCRWNPDLDMQDEKDIRWVVASNGINNEPAEMQENGDWLVQLGSGQYEMLPDAEFHAKYEAAE